MAIFKEEKKGNEPFTGAPNIGGSWRSGSMVSPGVRFSDRPATPKIYPLDPKSCLDQDSVREQLGEWLRQGIQNLGTRRNEYLWKAFMKTSGEYLSYGNAQLRALNACKAVNDDALTSLIEHQAGEFKRIVDANSESRTGGASKDKEPAGKGRSH